jgi:hypothetical protein
MSSQKAPIILRVTIFKQPYCNPCLGNQALQLNALSPFV